MADTKSLKAEQDRLSRKEKLLKRDQLRVQEQITANVEENVQKKEEEMRAAQQAQEDERKKRAELHKKLED